MKKKGILPLKSFLFRSRGPEGSYWGKIREFFSHKPSNKRLSEDPYSIFQKIETSHFDSCGVPDRYSAVILHLMEGKQRGLPYVFGREMAEILAQTPPNQLIVRNVNGVRYVIFPRNLKSLSVTELMNKYEDSRYGAIFNRIYDESLKEMVKQKFFEKMKRRPMRLQDN